MNTRDGAETQFLSADEVAAEAELLAYAARVAPVPSAAFADRVVAATERASQPVAARGPRVWTTGLVHAAGRRLRMAFAQVVGGPSIPLRVRIQAGAMLVVAALLISAGAVLAAAGASSVVTWVAGPQSPPTSGPRSVEPALSPSLATDTLQTGDQPNSSSAAGNGGKPTQNPGNCGKSNQNPGKGNKPSQNPGNCGKPSQNPGKAPSSHPSKGGGPVQSPGSQASKHPDKSSKPADGGKPTQRPKPTKAARS